MATRVARSMVTEWGMSKKLGMVAYTGDDHNNSPFSGSTRHFSEQTAREIDEEVKSLIDVAYNEARGYLYNNIDALHRLAATLLEFETLTGEEVRQVMRGQPIERTEVEDNGPINRRSSVPQVILKDNSTSVTSHTTPIPQPS